MRVKSIMTKDVHVVKVPGIRRTLLKEFQRHRVSGLPVVRKDNGKLVGLVTSKDLFRRSNESQIALIMNKDPITCSPNSEINRVVRLMVDNHIHRLLVQRSGYLQGIVTPHDILPLVIERNSKKKVVSLVKRRCVPIYQETPMFIAWRILKISQSYGMPIIDSKGHVAGIITDRDFFRFSKVGQRTKTSTIGVGEDEDIWSWESLKSVMKVYYEVSDLDLPKGPIKKYMKEDPVSVFIGSSVHQAARIMYENNFRTLPIIDNRDNLVNMVSDLDIISTLV